MKGLNQTELEQLCDEVQTWVGAQLQEILAGENHIALGFYHDQKVRWLMFDFATQSPLCLVLEDAQVKRLAKQTKPITLFVRAHFEGKRVSSIELAKDQGRVLNLVFHNEDISQKFSLEVILFSYAKNFIARAGDKKISFFKPKEVSHQEPQSHAESPQDARSFLTIQNEWLIAKGLVRGANMQAQPDEKREKLKKLIQKKSTALEKMQADLLEKSKNNWSEVGEWLKLHQTLKVPDEFVGSIDIEKSLSQNIALCFQKAKDQERKVKGAGERARLLAAEIKKLQQSFDRDEPADGRLTAQQAPPKKNFLQKVGAQARTFKIDESLQAYIGKSAKDNLDILRRAQPFDLWLHLRDIPSAHVVIRRTRERQVSDAEFRKIAQWLIAENFGKKAKDKSGEFFDLIICECRFVKPIKGDKLGRVNYQNDRSLRVQFES